MLRALPAIIRFGGSRSVSALVGGFIRDTALRKVFSLQPLLIGGHPFRTSAIYALIPHLEPQWGVWFPRGGAGALVSALEELMVRHGIRLQLGRTVSRIMVSGGRAVGVELEGGVRLSADIVIANSDALQVHAAFPARPDASQAQGRPHELFDGIVRAVLRHRSELARRGALHNHPRRALARPARRDLRR